MGHQHTEFNKRTLFAFFDAILPDDGLTRYQSPGLLMVISAIVVAELCHPLICLCYLTLKFMSLCRVKVGGGQRQYEVVLGIIGIGVAVCGWLGRVAS